ncbi:putative transposase [Rhodococcus sp. 27YEA15]
MMFPLVRDLADDGIPVTVACRVLGFSTQGFYTWKRNPVTQRDWDNAHLINAAYDIHADDPAFGYRFIADELPGRGIIAGENRVARLCSQQRIWSVFAKKRGLNRKSGPPVHDDFVTRKFTAQKPNKLWLNDITEHWTDTGKLYLCAIKDGRFQGANATPSFGGCRGGFVERSVHRVFDASCGCVSSGNGEAIRCEHGSGRRVGPGWRAW